MILCQEKRTKKDENGDNEGDRIYFQFFTRDGSQSMMRVFEQDYTVASTNPLKRIMLRSLSNAAAHALSRLSRNPEQEWDDLDAVREAAGEGKRAGGRLYVSVQELYELGYLIRKGGDEFDKNHIILQRAEDIQPVTEAETVSKQVKEWLFKILGAGKNPGGVSLNIIKKAADSAGIAEASLYSVKKRNKDRVRSEKINGETFWILSPKVKDKKAA